MNNNKKIIKPEGELAKKFRGSRASLKIDLNDFGIKLSDVKYKPTKFIKVNGEEFTVRSCIQQDEVKLEIDESIFKKDDGSITRINKNIAKLRNNFGRIKLS